MIKGVKASPSLAFGILMKEDIDLLFAEGLREHLSGGFDVAQRIYIEVLSRCPEHFEALHHLGLVHLHFGRISMAVSLIRKSLDFAPQHVGALANLGHCLNVSGDHQSAHTVLMRAVEAEPGFFNAWMNLGNSQRALGLHSSARDSFKQALQLHPNHPHCAYNLGLTLLELADLLGARYYFELCIASEPKMSEAHNALSACLLSLGEACAAMQCTDLAIALNPEYSEAYINRGNALLDLRRVEEALGSFCKAIELSPKNSKAWSGRGSAFRGLGLHEESLSAHRRAVEIDPESPEAWYNLGNSLIDLRREHEALRSYERAVELKSDYSAAHCGRAEVLRSLKRFQEALACLDQIVELESNNSMIWRAKGDVLRDLKRYGDAISSYQKALELDPSAAYLLGDLIHLKLRVCDWTDFHELCEALKDSLHVGNLPSVPFIVLGLFDNLLIQRRCAELFTEHVCAKTKSPVKEKFVRFTRKKVRVGYFSMDFREHPVAHLIAEVIETHDRSKFEIFGFSFGPNTQDPMRRRMEGAFDEFLEVEHLGELDIARLSREMQIDIAVDLMGHTQGSRPRVFCYRAAPIQISWLGYPGSTGIPGIDYLIADSVLIPEVSRNGYSEKIIYLTGTYQANDTKRAVSNRILTRSAFGLPEMGFVFCCFNNNWKILPSTFNTWAQILDSAPGSVLWLYADNPLAVKNLQEEATRRGIDQHRLIFAQRMPQPEHLARYRLADLFLDSFPYGAHTTASDALWVGLPVLTMCGEAFSSRVASSLLSAVGLSELITYNESDYLRLAIQLANDPRKITLLREKLSNGKLTSALFNTSLFCQRIESGYQAAYSRYSCGLNPDDIYLTH